MTATDLSGAVSNSLSLSSILILTALGLAITFGVMRVINMAHGEMMMLGAYTAYVVTDPGYLGLNIFAAIPAAFLVVGFVGYLLEVSLIRFLYGRPLDTLLATWGVGLILQQVVLLNFGTDLKPMHLPDFLERSLEIPRWNLTIPYFRMFIAGVTVLCLLGVYLWFYKTTFGLKIRAVVQNRPMAAALGISTRRVDSATFAFASGLAGVAGCVLGHLYTVKVDMGASYIVKAFMVVILGGLGQLAGSVAGGTVIGSGQSFVEKEIGNTPIAEALILLAVVVVILIRPSGLFAAKERTYE
jgi:urea transport system permease protein